MLSRRCAPRRLPTLDASAPGVLRLPVGVWVRVAPTGEQGEAQGGLLLQVSLKLTLVCAQRMVISVCGLPMALSYVPQLKIKRSGQLQPNQEALAWEMRGAQAGTLLASGLRRSAAARYSQEGCLQEVAFMQETQNKNAK